MTTVLAVLPAQREAAGTRPRPDLGRVAMVPVVLALLALKAVSLPALLRDGVDWVSLVGLCLSASFYLLVLVAYARRGPARGTRGHWPSHVAAVLASWMVLAFPFMPHGSVAAGVSVAGDALLLAGLAWSVWSLRTLGRSFSVLAQARSVVRVGPYRLVRHPLYFGELVACLGLALNVLGVWSVVLWGVLAYLQLYRSQQEEMVLTAVLADYEGYRSQTRRLVPFLF